MGAAHNQGYKGESGGKTESAQNLFHGFSVFPDWLLGLGLMTLYWILPGANQQMKGFSTLERLFFWGGRLSLDFALPV